MAKPSSFLRYALNAAIAIATAAFLLAAWRRVDNLVATLRSATFEKSVEHLLVDSSACTYMTGIKLGQDDLPDLLYNRHAVDIIESIAAVDRANRDDKCGEVFSRFFAAHAAAVRRSLDHFEDPNSPCNKQSMKLSESGVCTAILATALYGKTRSLLLQFAELDEFRAEIDSRLAGKAHSYPNSLLVAANTRNYYVPDNRFQLNALFLHAARIGGEPAQRAIEICSRTKQVELWNANPRARTSWLGISNRLAGVPIVRSHGTTRYLLYDWPSEIRHDQKAQAAVLEGLRNSLKSTVDSDTHTDGR